MTVDAHRARQEVGISTNQMIFSTGTAVAISAMSLRVWSLLTLHTTTKQESMIQVCLHT